MKHSGANLQIKVGTTIIVVILLVTVFTRPAVISPKTTATVTDSRCERMGEHKPIYSWFLTVEAENGNTYKVWWCDRRNTKTPSNLPENGDIVTIKYKNDRAYIVWHGIVAEMLGLSEFMCKSVLCVVSAIALFFVYCICAALIEMKLELVHRKPTKLQKALWSIPMFVVFILICWHTWR